MADFWATLFEPKTLYFTVFWQHRLKIRIFVLLLSLLRPCWGNFWSSWAKLPILGPVFGQLWIILGLSWAMLGLSWAIFGLSWAIFGTSWGHLGAILGLSLFIIGLPWASLDILEPLWSCRGSFFMQKSMCFTAFSQHRLKLKICVLSLSLLRPCWGHLGSSWAKLPILGPSWGQLWAILGLS